VDDHDKTDNFVRLVLAFLKNIFTFALSRTSCFFNEVDMQFRPNRILCVEDDEDTCQMMKVLLKMWDYEVVLAKTAADGFRLLQSERFGLCLLDASLPEESGFELCERICELDGHAPVVFISGYVRDADKDRGLKAGALAYLTKPVDFDLLEETMARLLLEYERSIQLAA
jgi:DNA-binding response OmpR family regulator